MCRAGVVVSMLELSLVALSITLGSQKTFFDTKMAGFY
uniref:Uncharacterized protein n=1 Tax=Rhizophora mucronata TaxID=61149 RepID=A0A2P2PNG3_RHIMU